MRYRIVFWREKFGLDEITVEQNKGLPLLKEDIIKLVIDAGFEFNEQTDGIEQIYQVSDSATLTVNQFKYKQ